MKQCSQTGRGFQRIFERLQKETRAVHMNIAPGSFFEMELPWVVEDDSGYTSRIKGTLMTPEATTSLGYRDFLQCETFEFAIDMTYPKYWNGHQEWVYTFTVSRASLDFIFGHKWFFCDLVDDWSSRHVLILNVIERY